MDQTEFGAVLARLREEGSDNQHCEVKAATAGMPQNVMETVSAFANTPGGGVLILGVDEKKGFAPVGVFDPKQCQQALAGFGKNGFNVPIDIRTAFFTMSGKKVVWAEVSEADKAHKPVKVKKTGKSYIRLYDGDYELSEQEEQMFVSGRGQSRFDEDPIPGSGVADLDERLTAAYVANRRSHSRALAKMSDEELLFRTGVTTRSGELTKAGVAALGRYPQQFMANYSIKVSVRKRNGLPANVRAVNVNSLDGPIPLMLSEAIQWVTANTDERVTDMPDGQVRSIREYPLVAVRELIGNALIHRDLSPMSMIQSISLTIEDGRLVIGNPGGLYGLSVRELGHTGSKTRNARLAEICQYVVAEDGANVIERLGSGIPKVLETLAAADMRSPTFIDGGIYFTAILASGSVKTKSTRRSTRSNRESRESVLAVLRRGALSRKELEKAAGLTAAQARYTLLKLIDEGKVQKTDEGTSPTTKYVLISTDMA